MNRKLKQDIAKAFTPVKRRGKNSARTIGKADPSKLFVPLWMFVYSLFIFLMTLIVIGIKMIVGKYP